MHYHYQKYKKFINYLVTINYWFLIEMILSKCIDMTFTFAWKTQSTNNWNKLASDCTQIIIILLRFISNVLHLSYLAYHSKNIRFSEWMLDIMKGYKLGYWYEECSIFIFKSPWYKPKYNRLIDTPSSICLFLENWIYILD